MNPTTELGTSTPTPNETDLSVGTARPVDGTNAPALPAVRIQRRRIKGWRAPEGAVYVGRGSRFGNPFGYRTRNALARVPALDGSPWEYESRISAHGMQHNYVHPDGRVTGHTVRYMTRAECVGLYQAALLEPTPEIHLYQGHGLPWLSAEIVREALAGRDLMCWCPLDEPCHADVLLLVAAGSAA